MESFSSLRVVAWSFRINSLRLDASKAHSLESCADNAQPSARSNIASAVGNLKNPCSWSRSK